MKVFTRIVDANSFSRAADSLNLPRASVTNIIQRLEAYLKVKLLQRTTRKLSLTPDGADYYERCVRILAEVDEAETGFSMSSKVPRGRLRIDMPGALGRRLVMPELFDFQERYPAMELALGFNDRCVDLIQEGVDCAIRVGALEDSRLVARRIGQIQCVNAVAPRYLALHGAPQTLDALQDHTAVNYFTSQSGSVLDLDFVVGSRAVQAKMRGRLAVNDAEAYLSCGVKGLGIIQVPLFMAQPYLDAGELIEVLPEYKPFPQPISAVYPHKLHLSPKVRLFVDWIADVCARSNFCKDNYEAHKTCIKIGPGNLEPTCRRALTQAKVEGLYTLNEA